MTRVYWDEVRVARLRKMLIAGESTSDIMAHFGKTKHAIQSQARKLGIKTVRKNVGIWTDDGVERFVKLCRAGKTSTELAEIFGVTRDVIGAGRFRYGVTYKAMKMAPPVSSGRYSKTLKIERVWAEEDDKIVVRGHGLGYLALSVGNMIHRRGEEVMARAVDLGLGPWPIYQPNRKGSIYVT